MAEQTSHTVAASELGRVLHNAALFVSKDAYRPILAGVEVSLNGKVETTATDSYRLGHDTCEVSSSKGEATVILDAAALAPIVKVLLSRAMSNAEATITIGEVTDTYTHVAVTISVPGSTWTLTPVEGTFPNWRQLIPTDDAKGELSGIGVSAKLIASFAKVLSDDTLGTLKLRFQSPLKPVVVNIGATFQGVIMPVRIGA